MRAELNKKHRKRNETPLIDVLLSGIDPRAGEGGPPPLSP